MTIGTLGSRIVFEVSDETALILQEMTREISGRWAIHETMGAKPKAEFLGPGLQSVTLPIYGGISGDRKQAGGREPVPPDRIQRNMEHHI